MDIRVYEGKELLEKEMGLDIPKNIRLDGQDIYRLLLEMINVPCRYTSGFHTFVSTVMKKVFNMPEKGYDRYTVNQYLFSHDTGELLYLFNCKKVTVKWAKEYRKSRGLYANPELVAESIFVYDEEGSKIKIDFSYDYDECKFISGHDFTLERSEFPMSYDDVWINRFRK